MIILPTYKRLILLILLILFITSQSNYVLAQSTESDHSKIEILIETIPKLNVGNESTTPDGDLLTPRQSVGFEGEGASRKEIYQEKFRLTKTLEKWIAFDPNADTLYPGALVQGSSLQNGVLNPITVSRTPLTITISDLVLKDRDGSYSEVIDSPSLASIKKGISKILNQNLLESQPARFSFSQIEMKSVEQSLLRLGVSAKWLSGSVNGSFNQDTKNYNSSTMVRMVQSYYTVSVDAPSQPASFISKSAIFENFKKYAGINNPSAYVASVTYGRELWLLIQSKYDAKLVTSALNAAYNAGVAGGSVKLSAEQAQIFEDSSIQLMAIGGGGRPAIEVINGDKLSKLDNYLRSGANYSRKSPASIISYTVRYLKDNDVARISSSVDYVVTTKQAVPEPMALTSITGTWSTTGDDKDWNTSPRIEVYDAGGTVVGSIGCCSSDRDNDNWDTGRSETRNLTLQGSSDNIKLHHGHFTASAVPLKGSDKWEYSVVIRLNFSDGSQDSYSCSGRMNCSGNW